MITRADKGKSLVILLCDVIYYVIAVRARRMVRIFFLPYLGNCSKSDPCSYELFCLESHILSFPKVLQIPPESPCMFAASASSRFSKPKPKSFRWIPALRIRIINYTAKFNLGLQSTQVTAPLPVPHPTQRHSHLASLEVCELKFAFVRNFGWTPYSIYRHARYTATNCDEGTVALYRLLTLFVPL